MDLVRHTKAHFEYTILDEYEAGIELLGSEVKSLRKKQGSLLGAHVVIRGGEAFVVGMDLPVYQPANPSSDVDRLRTRKLLLNKKQLDELNRAGETKGLTIIPIVVYSKGPKLKIKIAVVKGKKLFDKRESIKKRDVDRQLRREMKS